MAASSVLQLGLPEFLPDLLGIAATVVLLLIVVAFGGFVYKSLTGGIEWPDDREEDDALRRGGQDDEWDYY
ncbi:MAG: hypothetical protein ABEJ92_00990 [Halobacteriales archaeon]